MVVLTEPKSVLYFLNVGFAKLVSASTLCPFVLSSMSWWQVTIFSMYNLMGSAGWT